MFVHRFYCGDVLLKLKCNHKLNFKGLLIELALEIEFELSSLLAHPSMNSG